MNFILFITISTIVIVVFSLLRSKVKTLESSSELNKKNNSHNAFPLQPEVNDKLVVVKRIAKSDLVRVLKGFCKMYNEESLKAQLQLTTVSEQKFVITFPYNIDFETFCYFINYLTYPMELKWSPDVTAWTTTISTEMWITEQSANKRAMLYFPSDDTEHDNVYMTCQDNKGYKLSFGLGDELQLLSTPNRPFAEPELPISDMESKEFEDFK
jgi:hypothetical protein